MPTYLEHPFLKAKIVEKRLFQLDLAATALKASSLIVVPTGLRQDSNSPGGFARSVGQR